MSQQMNFDEEPRGYQASYSPPPNQPNPERGYYQFQNYEQPGQKIGPQNFGSWSSPSAGMRLALAIVSAAILVPLSAILLGSITDAAAAGFFVVVSRLIALGLVCLTLIIINVVFNRKH